MEIGSPALANVTPITQVGYDLLGSPDPATMYMIIDNTGGNNDAQSFRINQRLVQKIMVGGNQLWQPVVWATGGTVSDIDVSGVMWRVHTFTSSGSFEVLQPSLDIEYLIVAGGGRGGDGGASWGWSGGYGGGGGVLSGSSSLPSSVYPISIGNGGTTPGSNGGNTTFNGLVAVGGGAASAEGAAEEKDSFEVVLASAGDAKIGVMKVVKEVLGLGLKEAKDLVDGAPSTLKSGAKKDEAEALKKSIEEAGGKVELK